MHDIWNPWHGCVKYSEGCEHCYMYYLDKMRNQDGRYIYQTGNFSYPVAKNRDGTYKIQSGETLRVCMTSDFCLKEADKWRNDAWSFVSRRRDVIFYILTKRAERLAECLPDNWGDGYENVILNVTIENQKRADERMPLLMAIPAKHKGVMVAPMLGPVSLEPYLASGQIERVTCGGENYDGHRPCHYEWIKALHDECIKYNVSFTFIETGTHFVKDGRHYHIPTKREQSVLAYQSQLNYEGRQPIYDLYDFFDQPLPEEQRYHPRFSKHCAVCGMRPICNGCTFCGKCGNSEPMDNENAI
ncbi:MAG: DUF5131 family protein [Erysipelotrichaceae bacterium]|nr:DUF5131 family protein [Erysipelotrichaceae bacterium]